MRFTIVYLGGSRADAGCERESVDLVAGATIHDVADWVKTRHPKLANLLRSVRWARNFEFVHDEAVIQEGDEIAMLPPVAGGAPRVSLRQDPIDPATVYADIAHSIGATVVFIGTVRDHAHDRSVVELHYEAYEPMATRQLEKIANRCMENRPQCEVRIAHRYGRLHIGDVSVVIAAHAPHREDAFAACRQAIEEIKMDVPIWKNEIAEDGQHWVGWGGG